ncbi:MAG: hypothetical protein JO259_01590, partial [Mycobacterium sp.]|nr:hypothetical protein [Mycobacterium sp.]
AGLSAGLRWFYRTVQPDNALVEPRGACLTVSGRRLRFLPICAAGSPLIVVDADLLRWGADSSAVALNTLPAEELPCLADELAALGIPAGRQHYHSLTGTIALDAPAHSSLRAAVHRYARGCAQHHSVACDVPIRDGGPSCSWRAAGRRAAIWPDAAAGLRDSRWAQPRWRAVSGCARDDRPAPISPAYTPC